MAQPKTAHSGLQSFGRVIGFFLLFLFVTLVPIYLILFGVSRTLLSEPYLHTHLTDGLVRKEALGITQTVLSSAASENNQDPNVPAQTQSSVVNSPQVTKVLEDAVSDSTFNTVIDTLLTNLFAFLRGEKDLDKISINTTDLQKSIITGIQKGVTQLPACGPNEVSLLEGENSSDNKTTALCKPQGLSDAELVKFAKNPEFTNMISQNIPATYSLKDLPNFEDVNYQAKQVRHYFSQLTTGVVYGGIILVLALILGSFLWHQHLWYGLQTLGITMFIPLATVAALAGFGQFFLSRLVVNDTISQDPTTLHTITIGWYLISPMLAYIFMISVVGAGMGLVLFVVMEIIRHIAEKRGLNAHEAGAMPKVLQPRKSAKK